MAEDGDITIPESSNTNDIPPVDNSTAKETITEGRTETTVEASVDIRGENPFNDTSSVTHTVSETTTEKRTNGQIKTEHQETTQERWTARNTSLKTETTQTTRENSYYANGELKSASETIQKDKVVDPSAANIAHGHTDALEYGNTIEKTQKFNRDGTIREEDMHTTRYGSSFESRHDSYSKGVPENPTTAASASILATEKDKSLIIDSYKNAHPGQEYAEDNPKSAVYTAKIGENSEEYSYQKNNREYHVSLDSEGNLNATKTTMKKDAEAAQSTMGKVSSRYELYKMRQKADNAIQKATNGEYGDTQEYFNSVNAPERKNTGMFNDYFDNPEDAQEIEPQIKENVKNQLEEKSKVNADMLIQQKIQNRWRE
ncbi:MAG: hypothetical protein J6Y53_05670 [Alphaproteobacteria bacterium]|nr:hypothetical protein [Alphaproteobacteria bacterium]